MKPQPDVERAAELVARGDVVAFTGAGISAESGIPTFRDPGGLWDRYDPMRFGTFDGIAREAMEHPDELADYLTEMKQAFWQAHPNPGHVALADLERAGLLIGVVTQNVDGLHREAGNTTVVEVHGSNRRRVCLSCGNLEEITREEYLAGMERIIQGLRTAFVPSYPSLLPRCSVCGGPARPDVVAFGEAVKDFGAAERLAERAKVLLVVGTTGQVYPAAALPAYARGSGGMVVEVAKGPTFVEADVRIESEAGRILPEIVRLAVPGRAQPGAWIGGAQPTVLNSVRTRAGGGWGMATFPSEEWLKLYVERINESKEYREAAATWEGDIAYVFEAEPDKGVGDEVWAWLDLWHGECRDAKYNLPPEEGEKSRFIIRAPYSRWKEVIRKELDPVKGMMQGKLKLKGDLPTIVRYVKAANELVNLAQTVPTEFIDEK